MRKKILYLFCLIAAGSVFQPRAHALSEAKRRAHETRWSGQILENTIWEDAVIVTADVVVMPGVTLTVQPGTVVKFTPAQSTKTDAYYFSPQTELVIRGQLVAEGLSGQPIVFTSAGLEKNMGDWAGIILDTATETAVSSLINCRIEYVQTGVYVLAGEPIIKKNQFSFCDYAIISQLQAAPIISQNSITDSRRGIFCLPASLPKIRDNVIKGCQEEAIFVGRGSFPIILDDNRFQDNGYDIRRMSAP